MSGGSVSIWEIELLDPHEVKSLMDACSNPRRKRRYPTGIRNRALIALLYRTGLRCSEALSLYPEDLSEEHGTVIVRHGKGNKRRVVGMDQGGFAEVREWVSLRPDSQWLFCTLEGNKLDASYVRHMLARKKKAAGVTRRVHAHGLRHTHAGELALEQVPLPLIQAQLGHAHLNTTAIYLRGIAPGALIQAIRTREWKHRV